MTRLPVYITGASLIAILVAGFYVMHSAKTLHESAKPPKDMSGPAKADEALKNAPKTGVIPSAFNPNPAPPPKVTQTNLPAPEAPSASPAPGMTPTEIEGRKAAWVDYYKRLGEQQTSHEKAISDALAADTVVPAHRPASTGGAPGGVTGQMAPPGIPSMPGGMIPGLSPQQLAAAGGLSGIDPRMFGRQEDSDRDPFEKARSSPATDYLQATVTQPISPYELKAGDIIPCSLLVGVTNETRGQIKAMVTQTVFDHATGMHPLIPQGSTLVGTYDMHQNYGDERIPIAFTRVIYPPPGDESLDIGAMTAGDQEGYGGWSDRVDRHIGRIIFNAVLQGAFGAVVPLSQQALGGAIGSPFVQAGNQLTGRSTFEAKPTLQIRPGYSCSLQLTKDIAFAQPWEPSAQPIGLDQ